MAVSIEIKSDVQLNKLLSTDPDLRSRLNDAMRIVMWEARKKATREIAKYMFDSAHEANKAIRNSVYRKVIGANLNIYNVKRAKRRSLVKPSWRGRTAKTESILSYWGVDRGMVLRWVNDGTNERITRNMDGHPMYRKSVSERPKSRTYKYPSELGHRGKASSINTKTIDMFEKAADPIMDDVARKFQSMIDRIILELL